jgi:hypothetical protein
MLSQLTIPNKTEQSALDYQQLYAIGLKHVQRLSSEIWTDYNVHDPGITTLELLCYALTDLSYRASFPIEDLLASKTNNAEEMKKQFFTARQILPNRPLTLLDYRKLLIDIDGVKNAWLQPASLIYYADMIKGELLRENPHQPGIIDVPSIVEVNLAGLYKVKIEYGDEITTAAAKQNVIQKVQQKLQENRNLCEDFVQFTEVEIQSFQLCAELELAADADVTEVNAAILFQVQQYLAPSVNFYTLSEMLTRTNATTTISSTPYTVDEIFEGPALNHGFIDDNELKNADLRTEIRLSDIISIIMDIPGVQAVRDIVINPEGNKVPLVNKWVIPVETGKQAKLNSQLSRLVFYKRNMPVVPGIIEDEPSTIQPATDVTNDLAIPLGKYRELTNYYSFQNHFPAIYGLSDMGLSSTANNKRKALAYQLKAYLLFFDQIMANYLAQLSHVKELFSINPDLQQSYFYQVVNSFADYNKIYANNNVIDALQTQNNNREKAIGFEQRNRFLDHLISRFAEQFYDFANTMYSVFGESPESIIRYKCKFLDNYPTISSERSLAYNYSLTNDNKLWNSENVSGLERRLAKLLGIPNYQRRNLSNSDEGMYLIENILLRLEENTDPFLPICPNQNCTDCAEADPYSYRITIILPAYSSRFRNMNFRRFAEEIIREETPAHILPKICWLDKENMAELEKLYRDWIYLKAGVEKAQRGEKLKKFIDKLFTVKSVYPPQKLSDCDSAEDQPKFILGQTALGTGKTIKP